MRKTTAILTLGIILLLITGSLPVLSARPFSLRDQEAGVIQAFFDKIDRAAQDSHSMSEFFAKLKAICQDTHDSRFPALQALVDRVKTIWNRDPVFYLFGIPFGNDQAPCRSTSHFVLSYGAYHRYNPLRQNTITVVKDRLSTWHYNSNIPGLKGHTLIIDRHPFAISKRLIGPQVGIMRGFHGLYIDHQSKLTGTTYLFFLGTAQHIHALSLAFFK